MNKSEHYKMIFQLLNLFYLLQAIQKSKKAKVCIYEVMMHISLWIADISTLLKLNHLHWFWIYCRSTYFRWVKISLFLNQMKFCWHLISSLCIHWYSSWKFTTKLISQRIFLPLQYSDTMSFKYSNCKLLFMTSSFCDLLGINWFTKTSFYNQSLALLLQHRKK